MARRLRRNELLLGTEGAALFRHLLDGSEDFIQRRVEAMKSLAAADGEGSGDMQVPELSVAEGYAAWAPTYDSMSNALIRAEEPLVRAATADLRPGRALDAACGTGRHAAWLSAAGHVTTGIDSTPAMLEIAQRRVPEAEFKIADLTNLPLEDASFDFAICALSLTHLPNLTPGIRELARVVRPGGRIVLSDPHPTSVLIQGQALFRTEDGLAYVRNFPHLHGAYLRAFKAAGLSVIDCLEAPMEADFTRGLFVDAAEAAAAVWQDIPVALVWSLRNPIEPSPGADRG